MNALKELLAELVAGELLSDEVSGRISEAYEFDVADYTEQLAGLTESNDGLSTANGELNTTIAQLTQDLEAKDAELVATKAMNFDKLMNGEHTSSDNATSDDATDEPLTLDELIEQATEKGL